MDCWPLARPSAWNGMRWLVASCRSRVHAGRVSKHGLAPAVRLCFARSSKHAWLCSAWLCSGGGRKGRPGAGTALAPLFVVPLP